MHAVSDAGEYKTPVSPTRTTPPSFYPMLDASPSSPTPSLLSSHSPITNNELAYIPPTQPSWPHTSLPRSSLRSYTHSQAPPRCPFIVNNNTNANVAAPAAADPQKTAVVGDSARSCSPALHVINPPRPRPQPQHQPPLPPSLTSSSTTNRSVSGLLVGIPDPAHGSH